MGKRLMKSWLPAFAGMTSFLSVSAFAAEPARIAIIIDDLGQQQVAGVKAISLPGPVALSFLPRTQFADAQARAAHGLGKEVLLHLPLQPGGEAKAFPTAIRTGTDHAELRAYFRDALDSVPYAAGVNNHQGSLLTEMPQPMNWLMEEFALHPGLYFVDSRTSASSIAYRAARQHGVPAAERSVFLDAERGEAAVRAAFHHLVAKALKDERALAIGHPHPETLKVLNEEIPKLKGTGVELVTPSELIARQGGARGPVKQLKLSPALTLATSTTAPIQPAATPALAH